MDYDSMHEYMRSLAKGIALIQLNIEDLRKVELIVPPVVMQDQYIAFMEQSDKSKFLAQKSSNLNLSRCSGIQRKVVANG